MDIIRQKTKELGELRTRWWLSRYMLEGSWGAWKIPFSWLIAWKVAFAGLRNIGVFGPKGVGGPGSNIFPFPLW